MFETMIFISKQRIRNLTMVSIIGCVVVILIFNLAKFYSLVHTSAVRKLSDEFVSVTCNTTRPSKPSRPVILYGAHDRYNFGDILFSQVLGKLLRLNGYEDQDILIAGLVDINMSEYGGFEKIIRINKIIQMSHRDTHVQKGPYDIIFIGGEIVGCDSACGAQMMMSEALVEEAKQNLNESKIERCAYLFDKSLLSPSNFYRPYFGYRPQHPVAIVNGAGRGKGAGAVDCSANVDFARYRDGSKNELTADSAVLTDLLFHETITEHAIKNENTYVLLTKGYIAVQINMGIRDKEEQMAKQLDLIANKIDRLIVFFCAGTAPGHDSFETYLNISRFMKTPFLMFEPTHTWRIVGLISRADLVISTSLHVRIMAFIHARPRVLFSPTPISQNDDSKHSHFLQLWEAKDFSQLATLEGLSDSCFHAMSLSMNETKIAIVKAILTYTLFFKQWLCLLGG
jgi:Polysaccharide pyruvyl transferase